MYNVVSNLLGFVFVLVVQFVRYFVHTLLFIRTVLVLYVVVEMRVRLVFKGSNGLVGVFFENNVFYVKLSE